MFSVLSYHYKKFKPTPLPSLDMMDTLHMIWYNFLLATGIVRPSHPNGNNTDLPAVSNKKL